MSVLLPCIVFVTDYTDSLKTNPKVSHKNAKIPREWEGKLRYLFAEFACLNDVFKPALYQGDFNMCNKLCIIYFDKYSEKVSTKWMTVAVCILCHLSMPHMHYKYYYSLQHMKQEVVSSNSRCSPAVEAILCMQWTVILCQSAFHSAHETIPDIQEGFDHLQFSLGI